MKTLVRLPWFLVLYCRNLRSLEESLTSQNLQIALHYFSPPCSLSFCLGAKDLDKILARIECKMHLASKVCISQTFGNINDVPSLGPAVQASCIESVGASPVARPQHDPLGTAATPPKHSACGSWIANAPRGPAAECGRTARLPDVGMLTDPLMQLCMLCTWLQL